MQRTLCSSKMHYQCSSVNKRFTGFHRSWLPDQTNIHRGETVTLRRAKIKLRLREVTFIKKEKKKRKAKRTKSFEAESVEIVSDSLETSSLKGRQINSLIPINQNHVRSFFFRFILHFYRSESFYYTYRHHVTE